MYGEEFLGDLGGLGGVDTASSYGGLGVGSGNYAPPNVGDYGDIYNLWGAGGAGSGGGLGSGNYSMGAGGFNPAQYAVPGLSGPVGSSGWFDQLLSKFQQNPVTSLAAMANLGNQVYGYTQQGGQQQAPPSPQSQQLPGQATQFNLMPQQLLPMQQPAPQLDPKQVLAMRARQQEQGISTGGAASPDSLAALMGPGSGYNPDFIRMILQRGY